MNSNSFSKYDKQQKSDEFVHSVLSAFQSKTLTMDLGNEFIKTDQKTKGTTAKLNDARMPPIFNWKIQLVAKFWLVSIFHVYDSGKVSPCY